MATYKGKTTRVNLPAETLYGRMSNFGEIRERIPSLPEDLRAKLGTVQFPDDDTMSFTAPGVGEMKFRIVERNAPNQVKMLADTGVIPIYVVLDLDDKGDEGTDVGATIEAEIPMMLKPLIGGKLQEAADKFGEMFAQLNQ